MGWLITAALAFLVWYGDFSPFAGKVTVYTKTCISPDGACSKRADYVYSKTTYRASFDSQVVVQKFWNTTSERLADCTVLDGDNWSCINRYMSDGELRYHENYYTSRNWSVPKVISKWQWFNEKP